MEEKRFLVIDERVDGNGDIFQNVFETLEEANKDAAKQWNYLTGAEKEKRHIHVVIVKKSNLCDWAIDEDGEVDWSAFTEYNYNEQCFDSLKL